MIARPRLLVVDACEETREVLRTSFGPLTDIFEASRIDDGLALARSESPDVVVLDLECEPARGATIAEGFRDVTTDNPPDVVVLGTARQARQSEFEVALERGQFLRKPYHYGPLIRKIEELLGSHERSVRRAA